MKDKVQALLVKHQVDVVAPLNVGLLPDIGAFFQSNQTPLLINSLGEDVFFDDCRNPYIFVNSFNLWQAGWLSGYWGGANWGKRACSIAALHDGGQLLQAAVTHRETPTEDPSEFITMIAEFDPDFIFGLYSGKEALSFLEAYDKLGYRGGGFHCSVCRL